MLGAERAGGPVGAAARSVDHGVQVHRRARELGRRGDQARLQLAGTPALANYEVAQHARPVATVIRRDRLVPSPVANRVAGRVVGLRGEQAVLDRHNVGPAAAAVKAEREPLGAGPERVLELVAIAPLLRRRLDRLQLEPVEAADATERVVHLCRLLGELALVGHALPGGAGAGLASVQAAVGDPLGARAHQLDRLRLAVVALGAGQAGAHAVARESAADEDDVAVRARDAAAALGERVDLQLQLRALARAGAGGGGGVGHAPMVSSVPTSAGAARCR